MSRRFPLQTLLDLTQSHTDAAAGALHALKGQWQIAEDKLSQLLQYENDYRARLQQSTQRGMSVYEILNFQQFLVKLEVAIIQQREEVNNCKNRWELGQLEWQQHKRKLNAYDTLSDRHRKNELKVEARQEQREQDDLSNNKRSNQE